MATPPKPNIPEEVYGIFCGGIDQNNSQKIVSSFTVASNLHVKHVHLLFQTNGGAPGDGVFLYNFFKSLPMELTLYNGGQISSAGVLAYLGAKTRRTNKSATFMLHRTTNSTQFADTDQAETLLESLILDDERMFKIIREHVSLPEELWRQTERRDVYLSGDKAVEYGLAHAIGEFAPTFGTQIFNILV